MYSRYRTKNKELFKSGKQELKFEEKMIWKIGQQNLRDFNKRNRIRENALSIQYTSTP